MCYEGDIAERVGDWNIGGSILERLSASSPSASNTSSLLSDADNFFSEAEAKLSAKTFLD
jgi:hypothetical protein